MRLGLGRGLEKFLVSATVCCAVIAGFALVTRQDAAASGRPGFGPASLRGSYALRGAGGPNEAASVGVTTFDGAGMATRSLILNSALPPDSRQLIPITSTGTYEVNPDGTGTAIFDNLLPNGSTTTFSFDFVITRALEGTSRDSFVWRNALVANEVFMVQREPGIAAQLVTFDLTRLPN